MLDRIAKARARKPKIREERITLSHGAGGKATQTLIEAVFLEAFRNPVLEQLEDGAQLTAAGRPAGLHHRLLRGVAAVLPRRRHRRPGRQRHGQRPGHVRRPAAVPVRRVHPGGGLPGRRPAADRRLDGRRGARRPGCRSSPATPRSCERGKADGCYITTAGRRRAGAAARRCPRRPARPGDAVLVSGPIGDHGDHRDAGPRRAGHRGRHRVRHRPAARGHRRAARRGRRRGAAAARRHPRRGGHDLQRGRGRVRRWRWCSTRRRCRCGRW